MEPPPQVPDSPLLGEETARPEGSESVKPMLCSVVALLLFWRVKLRLVELPSGMLDAPNVLAIVGGDTTVMLAFAAMPVPALVEVTETLLVFAPAVVPCTVRITVHEAPGLSVAPERLTEEEPAVAAADPLQLLFRLLGVATIRPDGRVSVNATPVMLRFAFVLETVRVRLVVPLTGIVASPNALPIAGGAITVRVADEVLPLPASVESMVTLFE